MCQLINETELTAEIFSGLNQEGKLIYTCVIKAGFEYTKEAKITELSGIKIITGDQWRDEPGKSSLQFADESVPFKQGAEILLNATAYSNKPVTSIDIAINIQQNEQNWKKSLRVFGKRYWQKKYWRIKSSEPELFEKLPIIYEYAFGKNAYNPIGQGYAEKDIVGNLLPQIEFPPSMITAPRQQVPIAGFGAIPSEWQPRSEQLKKLHYHQANNLVNVKLPADFYNAAPLSQRFTKPFMGGEMVSLVGMTKGTDQTVKFILPTINFSVQQINAHEAKSLSPMCDTLVIDTEKQQFFMLWRTMIKVGLSDYVLINERT